MSCRRVAQSENRQSSGLDQAVLADGNVASLNNGEARSVPMDSKMSKETKLGEASAGLLHALTPEGSGRLDEDWRRVVGVLFDTRKILDGACTTMSNITSRSLRDLLGQ
ncbi:hypothetical protein CTAM01_04221 [Colletotrichum tamarilloi]|uniref:Uncharacterized protein n=1 Tax=Colletotrichum tamarilloi TaxID=1209934 RepID=A0ABQ9RI97_9PEZI|nr:uncharacterized protein CTAM01_04221 [Colletotrichum tamarilloi]KAK1503991.1 hypothetical protein CTAM01_04221 [Colletotrichum tamarilloi]